MNADLYQQKKEDQGPDMQSSYQKKDIFERKANEQAQVTNDVLGITKQREEYTKMNMTTITTLDEDNTKNADHN